MIQRIISGAQCGADQGGLYAASLLDIPTGGWAPKGWLTEAGPAKELMQSFGLLECPSPGYPPRTTLNVLHSCGTVIFGRINEPGSKLTSSICTQLKRPCLHFDVPFVHLMRKSYLLNWILQNEIEVLNVAGNRESINPGIQMAVCEFLVDALSGQS